MTELEKLIELIKPHMSGLACADESGSCELTNCRDCRARNCAADLLSNGVIVPPCKVGDKVYILNGITDGIVVGTITNLEENIYTTPREWITFKGNYPLYGELESKGRIDLLLGKTVFLSREEAEKALKERNKENG